MLSWLKTKNKIVGKSYDLSLVLVDDKLIKKLNTVYRERNKPTTILSFSLSENQGEIFISVRSVQKEAEKYKTDFKNYLRMIFVHGLLHLKGFEHGAKMENKENKLLKAGF